MANANIKFYNSLLMFTLNRVSKINDGNKQHLEIDMLNYGIEPYLRSKVVVSRDQKKKEQKNKLLSPMGL